MECNLHDKNRADVEFAPNTWILTRSPFPILIIISSYLYFVYKCGPKYMEHRKPYSFRPFLVFYNIIQVLSCFYIIKTILTHIGLPILQIWKCGHYELNSETERTFNDMSYFTLCLKIGEFIETMLFVLRKKQSQVTFLHVFHHCSTVILVYLLMLLHRGGAPMYPIFLNSIVHIIMYSYYSLSAIGSPNLQKKILPFKKVITIIQMIQFCLILLQVVVMASIKCPLNYVLTIYYFMVVVVIFYLFYDFYKKAYNLKNRRKSISKLNNTNGFNIRKESSHKIR